MKSIRIARVQAKAVLPAMLVATLVEGSMVDKAVSAVVVGQFSEEQQDQQQAIQSPVIDETGSQQIRSYTEVATEWTRAMAKRFRELAKKEALGTVTREEAQELEHLTQDRRNLEYPRSGEEVLWEYNQRQVTTNLVQALKDYVHFHSFSYNARSSAK